MTQLGEHPTFDFGSGQDLAVHEFEAYVRLCMDDAEPAWDSLSPFLSAPSLLSRSLSLSKYLFIYLFIYKQILTFLFIFERERMNGGRAEREGTQNLKQALGSELSAESLMWDSNTQTVRS